MREVFYCAVNHQDLAKTESLSILSPALPEGYTLIHPKSGYQAIVRLS